MNRLTRMAALASLVVLASLLLLASALALSGCGGTSNAKPPGSEPPAALAYPDYRALHALIVTPTCGPRGGVCHNSKQFPDLHTPENMLTAIGQRCNQLTEDPMAIVDQCEPHGDLLVLKSGSDNNFQARIGYVTTDGKSPPVTLTITLHDPVPHAGANLAFSIVRDDDPKAQVSIDFGPHLTTTAGSKTVTVAAAPLGASQRAFLTAPFTPGFADEVELGDPNQNGTFGYDLGFQLIHPGAPDKSFLVQRILGIVEPRMPLANGDLTADEIYALQCWIFQLAPDGSNADGPIDYARCPAKF